MKVKTQGLAHIVVPIVRVPDVEMLVEVAISEKVVQRFDDFKTSKVVGKDRRLMSRKVFVVGSKGRGGEVVLKSSACLCSHSLSSACESC